MNINKQFNDIFLYLCKKELKKKRGKSLDFFDLSNLIDKSLKETNDKAIMFSGEYKNGKRNGAGKEYYCDKNSIKFNGNYLDGERIYN